MCNLTTGRSRCGTMYPTRRPHRRSSRFAAAVATATRVPPLLRMLGLDWRFRWLSLWCDAVESRERARVSVTPRAHVVHVHAVARLVVDARLASQGRARRPPGSCAKTSGRTRPDLRRCSPPTHPALPADLRELPRSRARLFEIATAQLGVCDGARGRQHDGSRRAHDALVPARVRPRRRARVA